MRAFPIAAALLLGLTCARSEAAPRREFREGMPVVVVGEISSQPRDAGVAHERKMQVTVGPKRVDHTLHLDGAKLFGPKGEEIAVSDLMDKWWVRAEGTIMDDPRRIKVSRLQVIARDQSAFRGTDYFHTGWEHGYVEAVAGTRQKFGSTKPFDQGDQVVLIGEVSSQPRDVRVAHEQKMQAAVGPERTEYTLHTDDAKIWDAHHREFALSDIQDKMWVRAEGRVMDDGRRIQVKRLHVLGKDWAAVRAAGFARPAHERGFIMMMNDFNREFPNTKGR